MGFYVGSTGQWVVQSVNESASRTVPVPAPVPVHPPHNLGPYEVPSSALPPYRPYRLPPPIPNRVLILILILVLILVIVLIARCALRRRDAQVLA